MNLIRMTTILIHLATLLWTCEGFWKIGNGSPDHDQNTPNEGNFPRTFQMFSKPKPPNNERVTGFNPLTHVQNAFSGGSLGFQMELNPVRKVHNIIELGKKKIGFFLGNKKVPQNVPHPEGNPNKPYEEHETEDNGKDWEPQDPKKPNVEGPHWDDIGENSKLEDNEGIPIEDIIQPRLKPRSRSKRFIESKIYYVTNLDFKSNAKPNQVKIKSANMLTNDYGKEVNY